MYKVDIWIRTDVDIRVIVSVARPRDLWTPQVVVMGMEVLIEKLAIYEQTSRLH